MAANAGFKAIYLERAVEIAKVCAANNASGDDLAKIIKVIYDQQVAIGDSIYVDHR